MLSTDKAWEKFGREEPYFGVLAEERFASRRIEENREAFFASGTAVASNVFKRFEKHFGPLPVGAALDHGCGVGRLTCSLSSKFSSVLGIDVSPSMLAEATSNARKFGIANVRFALADDRLSNAQGPFDFINSFMVLQHVPVRRGLIIIEHLVNRLRAGGGIHLHVSIRTDRLRSRALWWASHHIPGVKIWQNIFARRPWNAPAMQMNDYPIGRVLSLFASHGISELLVATEQHGQFLTCSFLGRKSGLP